MIFNVSDNKRDVKEFACGYVAAQSIAGTTYKDITIDFPFTFSKVPLVVVSMVSTSTAYQLGQMNACVTNTTTSSVTIRIFNAGSTSRSPALNWIAIK